MITLDALSTLYYFQRIIQRKKNFIQFLLYRLICVIFFLTKTRLYDFPLFRFKSFIYGIN